MNKNYKVIKINGFRGILTAIFIVCCLATGFLVFPGWVCMHAWNYFASMSMFMPKMMLLHGIMLWSIIALSAYAINNNRFLIGFSAPPALNEEQIKDILSRVKSTAGSTTNPIMKEIKDKDSKSQADSLDEMRK